MFDKIKSYLKEKEENRKLSYYTSVDYLHNALHFIDAGLYDAAYTEVCHAMKRANIELLSKETEIFNDIITRDEREEASKHLKLFISQPMNGKTDEEILRERNRILLEAVKLVGQPIEVIDSFFESAPHDADRIWFLGKSIELLSTADIVYFADGWTEYRGCIIEHRCAVTYGLNIIHD